MKRVRVLLATLLCGAAAGVFAQAPIKIGFMAELSARRARWGRTSTTPS